MCFAWEGSRRPIQFVGTVTIEEDLVVSVASSCELDALEPGDIRQFDRSLCEWNDEIGKGRRFRTHFRQDRNRVTMRSERAGEENDRVVGARISAVHEHRVEIRSSVLPL